MDLNLETYAARIALGAAQSHVVHGCTSRCNDDCPFRGVKMELNIDELKETAELLASVTPESAEDVAGVCAEIHAALDLQDKVLSAEDAATAELKAKYFELRAPYTAQLNAIAGVIAAGKAAIVRRIEADEAAALEAIAKQKPVPAPTPLPKGLSVRRNAVLAEVEIEKLGEDYLSIVPNSDAILSAAEAGLDVPGATVEIRTSVVYKRPKKA